MTWAGSHHGPSCACLFAQLPVNVLIPAEAREQPLSFASSQRAVPPDFERCMKRSRPSDNAKR